MLIVFAFSVPFASAHPFTEETNPNSSVNAPVGITEIYVIYSEPIDIEFSSLKVFDNNGEQIDNKDTRYSQGQSSLIVTTPPLGEGVYTVASKVLSKVDGHLVPDAFIFGVGDVKLETPEDSKKTIDQILFFPEASARFPGLVGQTVVLGAAIGALLIWGTQNKGLISKEFAKIETLHHGRFMSITGIGLILVFASNIGMLAVQSFRLEVSAIDAIQTTFGMSWLTRMIITIILLGVWFWTDRRKRSSWVNQLPLLVLSLILIGTSSMIGHGAASGQTEAVIIDYIHNLVAAVWIGGIIYFVFVLLPVFSSLDGPKREKMSLVMIPRFSIAFIIAVGIVIITGPSLMWLLESNVGLITESIYGKLIFVKIAIAAIMVGLGGFFQFRLQKSAESDSSFPIHSKLKRSLKFDAALGIILLGVVALLSNGTLPAGEIQQVEAEEVSYGFRTIEFTENAKFDIEILPFTVGSNIISVKTSDLNGNPLTDSDEIKIKISNAEKGISPIEIPVEKIESEEGQEYKGEVTFGFSGVWQVEVEAKRTENANEGKILNLHVKPRLDSIRAEILEYEFPVETKPLYPLFDGKESIWISDPSAPRLWKFDIESKEFESFSFDGVITMFLTIDNDGKVWFTDTPGKQIGFLDPESNEITTIPLPKLQPIVSDNTATFIQSDFDGNIWIAITNKDILLKYNQKTESFEENRLKDIESLPFALAIDDDGKIWFTETGKGRIGYIDPETREIKEFMPREPLSAPEYLLFDKNGNLWIAEHTGIAISKFNPVLESFEKVPVIDQEALPYGMSFDRFGNIWIAQHTVDTMAAYDPDNDELIQVPIPTTTSFVQFTTTDNDDNVWLVEQRGSKLGMIKITEIPSSGPTVIEEKTELRYSEIVSPLMAMGIIATSLFFVKNIKDKRRLNKLVRS